MKIILTLFAFSMVLASGLTYAEDTDASRPDVKLETVDKTAANPVSQTEGAQNGTGINSQTNSGLTDITNSDFEDQSSPETGNQENTEINLEHQ